MIFKSKRKEKREACPIPSVQNKRVRDRLERLEKTETAKSTMLQDNLLLLVSNQL